MRAILQVLQARATKVGLAVAGVAVCFFTLTIVDGMLQQMRTEVEWDLERYRGKLSIQQPGAEYLPLASRVREEGIRAVLDHSDLDSAASTPLLLVVVEPPNNPIDRAQVMAVGLWPGREQVYLGGARVARGVASLRQPDDVILGSEAARFYRISDAGQAVGIRDRRWRVAGLLAPSGLTAVDTAVLLPLAAAQAAFSSNGFISSLLLTPRDPDRVAGLAAELAAAHPELDVATQEVLLARARKAMELPGTFMGLISWTVLFVAFLTASNIMVFTVRERARQLEVVQALAADRRRILASTLSETAALGLVGGVVGALAAIPAIYLLDWAWILSWPQILKVVTLAPVAGALAGLYPAFQATRTYPEALHSAELRQRLDEMAAYQSELDRAYRRLMVGREEERKRLARELHDQIIQGLLGLRLQLGNCPLAPSGCPVEPHLQDEVAEITAAIREICTNLRPPALDHFGLASALRSHCRHFRRQTGLPVELQVEGTDQRYPEEIELSLFRVAQEALVNAWKHAGATRVTVTLRMGGDGIHLSIADDGEGFDIPPRLGALTETNHFGLVSMRERAELVGGTLQIQSRPGSGTTIEVHVPASAVHAARPAPLAGSVSTPV